MARAIDWALDRTGEEGGAFLAVNVGSDDWNVQVRALAEAVAEAVPGTRVSVNADAPPDRRSYQVDFGLYRRLAPDHQPRVTLEQAVSDLRDGLSAIGFADPDFRASRLMRLRVLEELRALGQLDDRLAWSAPGAHSPRVRA
jgi:hypothetical protein